MKTVLRVALAFSWSIVPLQSWIVLLGAVGFVFGMIGLSLAEWPRNIGAYTVVATTGSIFMAIVPAMAGGVALRYASSRSMLHLRPHGRARLLAAALLTITGFAALIALPVLLGKIAIDLADPLPNPRSPGAAEVFAASWSIIAALWISVFVTSGSRLWSFIGVFVPLFILPSLLIRTSPSQYDMPDAYTWFVIVLVAWLLFSIWYLRARSFATPRWFGDRSNQNFESTPPGMLSSLLDFAGSAMTSTRASNQLLLGAPSPARYAVMTTAWIALFFVVFSLMSPGRRRVPGFEFVLIFGPSWGAQLAYLSVRRARMLWLRTGSDRPSLFSMAESKGLAATMWALLLTGLLVGGFAALRTPDRAGMLLLFAALQTPAWAAGFYCGLSLTRGWSPQEFFVCFGVALLFIAELAILRPGGEMSIPIMVSAAVVSLLVAALLRIYAKRRWLSLDWRIARLPMPGQRTT